METVRKTALSNVSTQDSSRNKAFSSIPNKIIKGIILEKGDFVKKRRQKNREKTGSDRIMKKDDGNLCKFVDFFMEKCYTSPINTVKKTSKHSSLFPESRRTVKADEKRSAQYPLEWPFRTVSRNGRQRPISRRDFPTEAALRRTEVVPRIFFVLCLRAAGVFYSPCHKEKERILW